MGQSLDPLRFDGGPKVVGTLPHHRRCRRSLERSHCNMTSHTHVEATRGPATGCSRRQGQCSFRRRKVYLYAAHVLLFKQG